MKILIPLLLLASPALADGIPFSGNVTLPDGKPAFGAQWGTDWTNYGPKLGPNQRWPVSKEGGYQCEFHWIETGKPMALFALDSTRRFGALHILEKAELQENMTLDVRLGPVAAVSGTVSCPDLQPMPPCHLVVNTVPTGARLFRLNLKSGAFDFPAPAGDYELVFTGADIENLTQNITVPPDATAFAAGDFAVAPAGMAKFWGKGAPELVVGAGRGEKPGTKLEDLKGKWVLVVFWSAEDDNCTRVDVPRLRELAAKHGGREKEFAIWAVHDGSVKTMAEYDAKVKKLMSGAWEGKELPWPVLLDPDGAIWKAWGVSKPRTMALVDPEGKLVRGGDDRLLDQKLGEKK